jgi:hypothetical protein
MSQQASPPPRPRETLANKTIGFIEDLATVLVPTAVVTTGAKALGYARLASGIWRTIPVVGGAIGAVFTGIEAYREFANGQSLRGMLSSLEAGLYGVSAVSGVVAAPNIWNPAGWASGTVCLVTGGVAMLMTAGKAAYDNWDGIKDLFKPSRNELLIRNLPTTQQLKDDPLYAHVREALEPVTRLKEQYDRAVNDNSSNETNWEMFGMARPFPKTEYDALIAAFGKLSPAQQAFLLAPNETKARFNTMADDTIAAAVNTFQSSGNAQPLRDLIHKDEQLKAIPNERLSALADHPASDRQKLEADLKGLALDEILILNQAMARLPAARPPVEPASFTAPGAPAAIPVQSASAQVSEIKQGRLEALEPKGANYSVIKGPAGTDIHEKPAPPLSTQVAAAKPRAYGAEDAVPAII